MAKANLGKNFTNIAMELTECPICMCTMTGQIFQCQSGHSLCHSCTRSLGSKNCPICCMPMTQMRNFKLEEIIANANIPCTNKLHGCKYVLSSKDLDSHLKECIFRILVCPVAVIGKCSWTGNRKEMMNHFREHHPLNCNIDIDSEVEFNDVSTSEDKQFVYLVSQGNILFTVTVKIDVLQKVAYWVIQLIGSKKVAQQHNYEIHITSKQDSRRKITFIDHCFNDAIAADEVYRLGRCAILPLGVFSHFIFNKKFSFKFLIKRNSTGPKSKNEKSSGENKKNQPIPTQSFHYGGRNQKPNYLKTKPNL